MEYVNTAGGTFNCNTCHSSTDTAVKAAIASNNLAILNFNNMDGYAARHTAPDRSAISDENTTMYGGPGEAGVGSITVVPVLYTPSRTIVSRWLGLTMTN